MPWLYVRRLVAQRWHIPPWLVDEAPWHEVETELAIMRIEAESRG